MKILPSSIALVLHPRSFLLALLLAFSGHPTPLTAQTVTGRVAAGTNPVSGVQFIFTAPGLTEDVFAVSDAGGNFSVTMPPGVYESLSLSFDWFASSHAVENRTNIVVAGNTDIGTLQAMPIPHLVRGTVGQPAGPLSAELDWTTSLGGIHFKVRSRTDFFYGTGVYGLYLGTGTWEVTAYSYYDNTVIGPQNVVVGNAGLDDVHIYPPGPFKDWAASYGLAGPQAWLYLDQDGDGHDNESEFAFGTHPLEANPTLAQTERVGSDLRISWLERADDSMTYSLRGSTSARFWSQTNTVIQTLPGAPDGYVRRQATMTLQGRGFFRVLAAAEPAAIPVESFNIDVAGAPVTFERWGRGPKALIFFGYIPFVMQENLKNANAQEFTALLGEEYSMFLWKYPERVSPFSEAMDRYALYFRDPAAAWAADKIDFSGVAASVVTQIRAVTGLQEVCLVANSFGAGVALADWTALSSDPKIRFVLVSPTELFMPNLADLPPPNPLPRTVLVADATRDPYFASADFRNYVKDRTNAPLPDNYVPWFDDPHLIIGENLATLDYVFRLVDRVYRP